MDDGSAADGRGRTTRRGVLRAGALGTALVVGALPAAGARAGDCDAVVDSRGGGDYRTIQDAVDDARPGDTVCVEPGTYDGPLTVDVENLTVRSVEPRAATAAGGDAETGAAVSVAADGVTLDGLAATHPDGLLGIEVEPGHADVTVTGCRVFDVGPVGRLSATGVLVGAPHDGLTVRETLVEGVRNEVVGDTYPTVKGIFVDEGTGGSLTDATIEGNEVRNLTSDVLTIGVIVGVDAERVDVLRNHVHGIIAEPGADSNDEDDPEGVRFLTEAQGINVSGDTREVRIARNVVEDVTSTYFVGTGVRIDGEADGLRIELNDLLPTVGLQNADAGTSPTTATATCNYWGDPKGPRKVRTNRAADDFQSRRSRSAVVGAVAFDPWLVRSAENADSVCVRM